MSADLLREAAKTLRHEANRATEGPWRVWGMQVLADPVGDSNLATALPVADSHHEAGLRTFNATYIATVQPVVGLALADLLEEATADFQDVGNFETCTSIGSAALSVARLILGEPR